MHALKQFWTTSSITLKAGIGIGLLILIGLIVYATHSLTSAYKDRKADIDIAAAHAEGTKHREQADAAEERAKRLEVDLAKTEGDLKLAQVAINAAGQKAQAAAEKIKDEDQRWVDEQKSLGVDVDPCERVKRTCARFHIKAEECSCTSN